MHRLLFLFGLYVFKLDSPLAKEKENKVGSPIKSVSHEMLKTVTRIPSKPAFRSEAIKEIHVPEVSGQQNEEKQYTQRQIEFKLKEYHKLQDWTPMMRRVVNVCSSGNPGVYFVTVEWNDDVVTMHLSTEIHQKAPLMVSISVVFYVCLTLCVLAGQVL